MPRPEDTPIIINEGGGRGMSKHIRAMQMGCLVVAAVVVAVLVLTLPFSVLGIAYGGGEPYLVDLRQGAAHGYWIVGPLVTVYVIGRLARFVGDRWQVSR